MMARQYRVIPSKFTVRAETSGTVSLQLLNGTVGLDLTTVGTVELWTKDVEGGTAMYTTAGVNPHLWVAGTTNGSVSFLPGVKTLVSGSAPYRAYFRLYQGSGQWFVPEDSEITINVRETY